MTHDHDEHEIEPIAGIPEPLPEGESLLWQGKPTFAGLALRVFHIRKVAIYFAILLAWVPAATLWDGGTNKQALMDFAQALPFPMAGLVLLAVLAKIYRRTTIFSITSKRVLIRFGAALSMTVNFPFSKVESVGLRVGNDGSGDLALKLFGRDKIAYLHLWPFAKPWCFRNPEPLLRAVEDPAKVSDILGRALQAELGEGTLHTIEQKETKQASKPSPDGGGLAVAG